MRKLVLGAILLSLYMLSCNEISERFSKKEPSIDTVMYSVPTKVLFQDSMIDLGKVNEGEIKEVVYHYKNIGDKPLLIFNVSPSCGCTIADFSHKPLMPGASDSIIAKFDSGGKDGSYQKNIKVNCNTDEKVHTLAFLVNVIKK